MPTTPRLEVDRPPLPVRWPRGRARRLLFGGPGDILCLLGPSGCGKSTVLRTIAGIERQAGGRVLADGEVLSDDTLHLPPERRGIGLIFQDFALFPHLSVGQNVAFGVTGSAPRSPSG
jgi:iron(III) transport system ATP-binding protein